MHEGWRAIAPDSWIRAQAEDVTAAAIAPERVRDKVKVLEHFKIDVHGSACTGAHQG